MITENKLTNLQLELLKSFKYVKDEKQLNDIKSLLNLYFHKQLEAAIEEEEKSRNYTTEIYEEWLRNSTK
ncbi:MAG: hypothetical protein ABI723_02245 [Bacteroidia bacterium]